MCTYTQLSASNTTFSFTKCNRHPFIQTCENFSHNTEFCRDQMPWWCSQPIWAPLPAKLQSLLYHTLHSYKIVLCYSRYVLFLKFIHLILFERKTKQERYKRRERERKCKAPFLVQSSNAELILGEARSLQLHLGLQHSCQGTKELRCYLLPYRNRSSKLDLKKRETGLNSR